MAYQLNQEIKHTALSSAAISGNCAEAEVVQIWVEIWLVIVGVPSPGTGLRETSCGGTFSCLS